MRKFVRAESSLLRRKKEEKLFMYAVFLQFIVNCLLVIFTGKLVGTSEKSENLSRTYSIVLEASSLV